MKPMIDGCYCDCECYGCQQFHADGTAGATRDDHTRRLLLAIDVSISAACRARGIAACDGYPGATEDPCDIGTLHTRAAELAVALADVIENPETGALWALEKIEELMDALRTSRYAPTRIRAPGCSTVAGCTG
jgi:hypothetical protein